MNSTRFIALFVVLAYTYFGVQIFVAAAKHNILLGCPVAFAIAYGGKLLIDFLFDTFNIKR